jgi:LmbE family N-acetylglucosaminyl deacetylase
MVGRQGGAALGILREAELRDCLQRLGVRQWFFLEREDFAYTEDLQATLERWDADATLERLVRFVRALRPEVVVTMNPAPTPGQHGHHQAAAWLAVEAFDAAADPRRFPDQIALEGLTVWRPRKLYVGGMGPMATTVVTTNALPDGRIPAVVAGEALANHRSQGFGGIAGSAWLRRPQTLELVKSVVPFVAGETNLFRGLPIEGATPPRVATPPVSKLAVPVALRFLPRPAVSRYLDWVEDHAIPNSATFEADVPVVMGLATPVPLEVLDFPGTPAGKLRLAVPAGWHVSPLEVDVAVPGQAPTYYRILQVTAPPGAGDVEMVASGKVGGQDVSARVRLHPVPSIAIPRKEGLALEAAADDPGWRGVPAVEIPHTRPWQGTVTSAKDLSATFRAAHDGEHLWVEVRVMDDVVVSNLAPDDIRGHWRSDSVEVCIDPTGEAEHTFGSFKLGIVPFDRSGVVRGVRDADAKPGALERVSLGTQLSSQRLPDGYLVRARIPWTEIGVDVAKVRTLGFNVLIYDGDKADAAPGENINRSRLAWSPRSGVQGRPEDWGRATLR